MKIYSYYHYIHFSEARSMNAPLCPHCWCPHTLAHPCNAGIGRARWHPQGDEQQRLADHAERIAIARFLRPRSAG